MCSRPDRNDWDVTGSTSATRRSTDPLTQADLPARSLQYQNPEQSATLSLRGWVGTGLPDQKHKPRSTARERHRRPLVSPSRARRRTTHTGAWPRRGCPSSYRGPRLTSPGFSDLPSRATTSFTYDVLSRKTTITYPGTPTAPAGNDTPTTWCRCATTYWTTDSRRTGRAGRAAIPRQDNVVLVETPNTIGGATTPTIYRPRTTFDPLDRLHIVTDAKANKTTINWDSAGRTGRLDERRHGQDVLRPRPEREPSRASRTPKATSSSITGPMTGWIASPIRPARRRPSTTVRRELRSRRAGRLANRMDEAGTGAVHVRRLRERHPDAVHARGAHRGARRRRPTRPTTPTIRRRGPCAPYRWVEPPRRLRTPTTPRAS